MTVISNFTPDIDATIAQDPPVAGALTNVIIALDRGDQLPVWRELDPDRMWAHDSGIVIVRVDHRPVLLTDQRCATCRQPHLDIARIYTVMSSRELYAAQEAEVDVPQ